MGAKMKHISIVHVLLFPTNNMFNLSLLFLHLYGNQNLISSSHTILFELVIFVTV
jgi:hypothetical protein